VLRRGGDRIAAELLDHGDSGVELQLFRNGEFFYRRRHLTRGIAEVEARGCRRTYEADGWIATRAAIISSVKPSI
jgi:hypothetical protein